jgi:hypothetical protein
VSWVGLRVKASPLPLVLCFTAACSCFLLEDFATASQGFVSRSVFTAARFLFPASHSAGFNPVRFALGAPFVDLLRSDCSLVALNSSFMVV